MNFSPLSSFLDHLTEEVGIPTAEIRVHRDGKELFSYGSGSIDPAAPLYNMYSMSKPITCAAALSLFEKGKFQLAEPLYEYMPEFREMTVKKHFSDSGEGLSVAQGRSAENENTDFEVVKAENPILIEHLFTMSAGFNYDTESENIKQKIRDTDGKFPTRMIAKALSEQPLDFEPGAHWQYSLCHDVLAAFVEVVSGKRFSDYVSETIFEPLGMTNSFFHPTEADYSRIAKQYMYDSDTKKTTEIQKTNYLVLGSEYDSGGAGIISTVDDYIKFADAMANGGTSFDGTRILSRSAVDLMRTNRLTPQQLPDFNWPQLRGYGYGLGVRTLIDRAYGGSLSPHGEFGWGGAAGSYIMIDPENRISAVYGQHMLNNLEPYVHTRIRNIIYGCIL